MTKRIAIRTRGQGSEPPVGYRQDGNGAARERCAASKVDVVDRVCRGNIDTAFDNRGANQ